MELQTAHIADTQTQPGFAQLSSAALLLSAGRPVQALPAQPSYARGRGIRIETWQLEAAAMAQLTFPELPVGPPSHKQYGGDFASSRPGTTYIQRLSALFTAPASGDTLLSEHLEAVAIKPSCGFVR